jgi:hypothetical protein
MSTKTLKSTFRRSGLLVAAFALVAATIVPAASTYADALNPLTERSLTLSSSSPGWSRFDASGNDTFAPPNSGANGEKTGNTFSFRVSSDSTTEAIEGLSFQYCTRPAGYCMGPGNIPFGGDIEGGTGTRAANGPAVYESKQSDLEIVAPSSSEVTTYDTKFDNTTGLPAGSGLTNPQWDSNDAHPNVPAADNTEGNFIVLRKGATDPTWTQSTGWEMVASVNQNSAAGPGSVANGTSSGKNNYITLVHTGVAGGDEALDVAAGDYIKIIFFATDTNYITNPGDKEFFVKINTFNTDDASQFDTSETSTTIIDGGVTVANVMNRSIEIQTKVLETMDFSVGTVDPNTLDSGDGTTNNGSEFFLATGRGQHSTCDPIVQGLDVDTASNILKLGDEVGEFSLKTDTTYSTHSYWRLSSNSSGGATVYYSGVTLSNTVGDQIDAIGPNQAAPAEGGEQFGLALANNTDGDKVINYANVERTGQNLFENAEDNGKTAIHATTIAAVGSNPSYHPPRLAPLTAEEDYRGAFTANPSTAGGGGVVNTEYGTINTAFAFDPESSVIPTPFAKGTEVLNCVTGKMRYIANIAATTPAGVYTTKINYIAAPQY